MRMDLNVLFCFVPAEVPYRKICLCPTEPFPRWKDLSLLYHLTAGMKRENPRIGKVPRLDQKNRSTAASFCLSAGGDAPTGEPPEAMRSIFAPTSCRNARTAPAMGILCLGAGRQKRGLSVGVFKKVFARDVTAGTARRGLSLRTLNRPFPRPARGGFPTGSSSATKFSPEPRWTAKILRG